MEKHQAAAEIQRILNDELHSCDQEIRRGDTLKAKQQLAEAVEKLNRLATALRY